MHINPDHYLQTPQGRVTTPERNAEAWERCHAELSRTLASARPGTTLYVMIGAQGSGKSVWARRRAAEEPDCIVFDAILVKRSERAPIVAKAKQSGVRAVAVWLQTPLEVCLSRNASRPVDEIAGERGLRNVHAALEPPALSEGFASIVVVSCG